MKLLLDTHALVWALEASPRLSRRARRAVEDAGNEVIVSAASALEIAIKKSLGRLRVPDDLAAACDAAGFARRPIGFAEARALGALPWHHRDPFDRLLVSHAIVEAATLVTRDRELNAYGVPTLW
jgi:PIN domain nuclease of toxin-antitoxin system